MFRAHYAAIEVLRAVELAIIPVQGVPVHSRYRKGFHDQHRNAENGSLGISCTQNSGSYQ